MKREVRPTKVIVSKGVLQCLTRQSKAGANCKNGQQVPCRHS